MKLYAHEPSSLRANPLRFSRKRRAKASKGHQHGAPPCGRRLSPMLRAVRLHRAAAVVRRFATAPPDLFAVLGVEVRRTAWLFCCACLTVRLACRQRRFDLDAAELHGSYKALMVRSRPYHLTHASVTEDRIASSAQARLHPDRFGTASQEEQLSVGDQAYTYVPEPPYCTYGLRVPASCVAYIPEAQGSWCATVRMSYTYQPRACRTYRVPWHPRWPIKPRPSQTRTRS